MRKNGRASAEYSRIAVIAGAHIFCIRMELKISLKRTVNTETESMIILVLLMFFLILSSFMFLSPLWLHPSEAKCRIALIMHSGVIINTLRLE